jgi:hypothetical protein
VAADRFPPAEPAAVDSVQVLTEDHFLEGFAGTLAGLNPWKSFPEVPSAAPALNLRGLQLQHAVPQAPVLMPHAPYIAAFVAQPIAAAVRTRPQPRVSGRNADPSIADL